MIIAEYEEIATRQGFRNSIRILGELGMFFGRDQWANPTGLPIKVLNARPQYIMNSA